MNPAVQLHAPELQLPHAPAGVSRWPKTKKKIKKKGAERGEEEAQEKKEGKRAGGRVVGGGGKAHFPPLQSLSTLHGPGPGMPDVHVVALVVVAPSA